MAGAVEQLIEELSRLPGIGRKTASRLTFYLLKQPRESASRLSDAILQVKDRISFCETCGNIAEGRICTYCLDPRRDESVICVVEEPSDIHVIEKSGGFRGRYHVLADACRRWTEWGRRRSTSTGSPSGSGREV